MVSKMTTGVAMAFLVATAACSGAGGEPVDTSASQAGALGTITNFGSNPGNLNMYEYVPAGLPSNAPVVVAMHGCTQSASDYVNAGWNQLADQWKFIVVYPETTSSNNQNKCFQWYDPNFASRGKGEALSIKQMVDDAKKRHSIDASRVFVTGLSAGAAMTSVMLAAYPDVFSAGAIMSGLPFQCATSQNDAYTCMYSAVNKTAQQWGDLVRAQSSYNGPFPRVSIWQGDADYTVRPVNADELVTQWTNVNGISATPTVSETVDGANHAIYKDNGGHAIVEKFIIPKMGHGTAVRPGWSPANGCGQAGAYILSESICSTYYAGVFFGLGVAAPPSDGGAPDAANPPPPPQPDASVPAPDASVFACKAFNDSIYNHVLAGRAYRCGSGNSYACTVGSNQQIGLWTLMPATLRETKPSYYEVGSCP